MSSLTSPLSQGEAMPASTDPVGDETPPAAPAPRRGWAGTLQILGIVALTGLAVGFSQERSATSEPLLAAAPDSAGTALEPMAALVNVVVPELRSAPVIVEATGSVTVRNRVQLVPEISGRVVAVSTALRAGGAFTAGAELLRIDASEFQLAVDQARADLAVARSQLRLAQAEAEAARSNYALLRPGQPVPPLAAKVPQIEQRTAEVAAAEARLAMAELELSRTVFSLPFDGRITSSTAEVGQVLKDGQSFGEAFSVAALEVAVPVTQEDLDRLAPAIGRTAIVNADGVERTAVVERVSAELDQRTRFAKLFLTFAQAAELAPGTFVHVTLQGPERANTFVLPAAAEQMNGKFWVADEGQLRRVSPQVIARTDQGVLVEAFDTGDGVVVGAVPGARDGLAVRTVTPDA